MSIKKEVFGETSQGKAAELYTITNSSDMSIKVSSLGAILVSLVTEDRNGIKEDIVLGYDNVKQYEKNKPGFGAVIGRNANRIRGAEFKLHNKQYGLEKNDGNNNLHSGFSGYHHRIWDAEILEENDLGETVRFSYFSKDMDQGFPGNLDVSVTYCLTEENSLLISYEAVSDMDTVVNLTNHTYFNLAGHASGNILAHKVWIDADSFTEADAEFIPTGKILSVKNTPMDFTEMKEIGRDIEDDYEQIVMGGGYDHNWCLKTTDRETVLVARMEEDTTGRGMEIYTDLPGLQLYTGNFLDGTEKGKENCFYQKRAGVCFETQYYPNSINIPEFPSVVLKAGEEYKSTTIFKFYIKEK